MGHLGLFEGIGGFSLAARWAGWTTPVMVEWNPYCQAVLKNNFPDAAIFGDIHEFDGSKYAGQIDIITGGFPCQPYSHAGLRAGNDDDRALWPQMLRVIREVAPPWVVGENVAGLLSMDSGRVFAGILADLENAGYSTETYLIPAVGVGAPHRRDRVWIVAHNSSVGRLWRQDNKRQEPAGRIGLDFKNSWAAAHRDTRNCPLPVQPQCGRNEIQNTDFAGQNFGAATNANLQRCEQQRVPAQPGWAGFGAGRAASAATNANNHPSERQRRNGGEILRKQESGGCGASHWGEHWYEVATRICGVDDGLSAGVDEIGGVPAKTTKGKAHRLEGLGDAIVPEIAYQIFDAINQCHAHHQ